MKRIIPRWWWVWILTGLLLGGGVGALLAGLPHLARAEIGARLETIATRTGFSFDIERLHVDLLGRIELSGVAATAPPGVGLAVTVKSIGTRLRVESLLRGERRLGDVHVDGLVATLDAMPEAPRELAAELERRARTLRAALRSPGTKQASTGSVPDLRVVVLGARVQVAGASGVTTLVDDMSFTVGRAAREPLTIEASGRLVAYGGGGFKARGALSAAPVAEVSFEPRIAAQGASLSGVRLDGDGTITVLGLAAEPIEALSLQLDGSAAEVVVRRGGQGPFGLTSIEARGVEANVWLPADRSALVATLKTRLAGGGGGGSGGGSGARLMSMARELAVPLRIEGVVHLHEKGEQEPVLELTGLEATAVLSQETRLEGRATLKDASGLSVPVSGRIDAEGLTPTRLEVGVEGAPLGKLLRERAGVGVFDGRGTADVTLRWERSSEAPLLAGEVVLHDLTVDDRRISKDPVVFDGLTLGLELDRTADGDGATVEVAARAKQGGHGTLSVSAKGLKRRPVYTVELDVPKQPCAALVQSVPSGMLPTLHGKVKTKGTLHGRLRVENLDPEDIPRLRFVTEGSWDDCEIVSMGPEVDRQLARIKGRFKQEVDEGEGPIGVSVGSAMGSYLPLSRIPPLLRAGPLLTEDGGFFDHKGFSESRLEGALRLDLAHGRYVYGGSSISQQLVKNLFLHRDKTLARKLEEALIVVGMERALTKERILELYLNCIEYGVKLYGIGNAARHYFGKTVDELTPLEIAFLMHLKTTPKEAWYLHRRGSLPQRWRDAVAYRMRNFMRKGWITQEEYDAAAPYDPIAHPVPTATAPESPPLPL